MLTWKTTTTALLEGLKDSEDAEAWSELDERVRPIVFALARRSGLDSHVAADVAQETLLTFLALYRKGRYDRERGQLGHWVLGIARNSIHAVRRSAGPRERRLETVESEGLGVDDPLARIWEEESRSALLRSALKCLAEETHTDPTTIAAFRRVHLDGAAPEQVARELSLSVNSVYLAKHRCLTKLRGILEQVDGSWELHL